MVAGAILAAATSVIFGASPPAVAATTISECSDESLRSAVASGGTVTYSVACAQVPLAGEIVVPSGVTATVVAPVGTVVVLDARNLSRHFRIDGGTLTLVGLSLVNGRVIGADGADAPGQPAGDAGASVALDPVDDSCAPTWRPDLYAGPSIHGSPGADAADAPSVAETRGGSILVDSGSLVLDRTSISESRVFGGDGGAGGRGGDGGAAGLMVFLNDHCPFDATWPTIGGDGGAGGHGGRGADGGAAQGGAIYSAGSVWLRNGSSVTGFATGGTGGRAGRGGDGAPGADGGPGWSAPANTGMTGGPGGPGGDGGQGGDEGDPGRGGAAAGGAIYNAGLLVVEASTPPVQITGTATGGDGFDETSIPGWGDDDFGGGDGGFGGSGGPGGFGGTAPGAAAGAGGPGGPGGDGAAGGANAGEAGGGDAVGGAIYSTDTLALEGDVARVTSPRVEGTARAGDPGTHAIADAWVPTRGQGGWGGLGGDGGWGPDGQSTSDNAGAGGDGGAAGRSGVSGRGGDGRPGATGGVARGGAIYDSGLFSATGLQAHGYLYAGAGGDGGPAGAPVHDPNSCCQYAHPGRAGGGTQGPRRSDAGPGLPGKPGGRGGDAASGRGGGSGGNGGDAGAGGDAEGGTWYHAGTSIAQCTECVLTAGVFGGTPGHARAGGNGSNASTSEAGSGGDGGWGGGALGSPDAPGKDGGNGANGGDGGGPAASATGGHGGNGGVGGSGGRAIGGSVFAAGPVNIEGGQIGHADVVAADATEGAPGGNGGSGCGGTTGGTGGRGGSGGQADGGGGIFFYPGGVGGNGANGGNGGASGIGGVGGDGGFGGRGGRGGAVIGGTIYAEVELHVYGGALLRRGVQRSGDGARSGWGGSGGAGGRGGNGGAAGYEGGGGFGSAGAPLGQPGEPGQPSNGSEGGHGGNAGSGAPGGDGGDLLGSVIFTEAPGSTVSGTDIPWSIWAAPLAGGIGGDGGAGGSGGSGGFGGDGAQGSASGPRGNGGVGADGAVGADGGDVRGGALFTLQPLAAFAGNSIQPATLAAGAAGAGGGAGAGGAGTMPGASGTPGLTGVVGQTAYPSHNAIETPNNPPAMSEIAPVIVPFSTAGQWTPPVPFTIVDIEDGATRLTPVATAPVPLGAVTFGGSGTNRTVSVFVPAYAVVSNATITVSITDRSGETASQPFVVSVQETRTPAALTLTATPTTYVGYNPPTANVQFSGTYPPPGRRGIEFRVYPAGSSCVGSWVYRVVRDLEATGVVFPDVGTPALPAGTYHWIAMFAGDDDDAPVTTECGAPGTITTVVQPVAVADTRVAPLCSPIEGPPGRTVTCTASVWNTGPDTAASVVLSIDLPAGAAVTQAPTGGGFTCAIGSTSPEIVCTKATQAPSPTTPSQVSYAWVVPPDAAASATFTTTYAVSSGPPEVDPQPLGNTGSTSFLVKGTATTVTAPATAAVGQPMAATATLGGATSAATGSITFSLYPPGNLCTGTPVFTSVAAVAGPGVYASGNYTPTATGTYSWRASYSGSSVDDPGSTSTCAAAGSQTLVQPSADLTLATTCTPLIAAPNGTVSCSMTVTNTRSTLATGVVLTATLPSGLTITKAASGGSFTCTSSAGSILCTKSSQSDKRASTVSFTVQVAAASTPGTTFSIAAVVTSQSPDATPGNNATSTLVTTTACTVDQRSAGVGQTITGTGGNDVLCGSAFADTINGDKGADQLFGYDGNDLVDGGAGADVVNGGGGTDDLRGGAGNDVIYAVDGVADVVDCGSNTDTVYFDSGLDIVATNCEDRRPV